MDDIEKEAIYYWQDKLAKFWPTIKGPSTVEIAMFKAGYKLATEGTHNCYDECTNPGCSLRRENARLREALERIAKNNTDEREIYTVGCDCDEEARAALSEGQ